MAKSINLSGLSCADNRAIILPSRLFDPSYYLSKNKDVKQAKIDPLNHFINYGAKEGRNPNAAFDIKYFIETYMKEKGQTNPLVFYIKTKKIRFKSLAENFDADFYLKSNPDVYNSKMDPLAHYLNYGIKEGREGCHTQYNNFNKNLPSSYLSYQFPNWINTCNYPATVVVPIFNAYSETKDCVVSLLKHVDLLTDKILFINDCSTDIRIKDLLASLTNIKNITIITNDTNLGYTNSVNLGIDNSIGTDVVLLNSDTRVTPNWLRNFKLAAYENDAIGTVTAVSNGAGAFSVPEAGLHDLPEGFNEVDMARLIQSCGPHERVEVPTGNGFCLFIKRSMLDVIGKFDASLFPRGYGEENYFCMQAIDHGFCNIVDPNTYVFHVRNASFKEEKQLLIDKGIAEVIREFPEYRSIVKMIGDSTHFKTTRGRIRNALLKSSSSANVKNPRILYVISTRTGGTPQTNHDLMRGVAHCFNSIALACNRNTIEILEATKQGYRVIEEFVLGDPIKFAYHRSKEYDSIFKWVLFKYGIELVHVRHLAWQSLNIFAVCRSMGVPAVNSFHDFYTICPTVNLIDDNGQFYPTGVTSPAKNPLWDDKNIVDYTSASSNRWKAKMSLALNMANAYVTTCESAKSILVKALPGVFVSKAPDCFSVFPHGRDFEKFYQYAEPPIKDKPLRVLLPGNISLSKGAKTVKAIKELDNEGLIEFHVLGTCIGELIPYVKCHGAYDRDDFSQRVKAIRPHIAAVLSIWPETYCHTLTESWACGVPVLGVNLGAVGDRIAQHGGGWLAENDPQQVYQQLVNIDLASWETKVESTIAWQSHYGADNTIASMATKYIGLYNNLLRQQRSEIPHYFQKIGLVMKGEFPNVPPTAYVRIVDWVNYFKTRYGGECEFINGYDISKVNFAEYKQLIVQRDSIPREHIDSFLQATNRLDVRLCLELDDNLLDVPTSIDSAGVYAQYRSSLLKLIKSAQEINVTNDSLAEICRLYNKSVQVRENKLSKERWLDKTVCSHEAPSEWQENRLNIVYFGSRTHSEDYQFLVNSLHKAINLGTELKLYVIGVTDKREDKPNFVEYLNPPSSRFDIFVDWFRGNANYFDLGVAPLMDTDFNRSKSHLKALEYLALGIPVLCSDVHAYKKMTFKSAVTLLENDTNVWADTIHRFEKFTLSNIDLDDYFIESVK